MNLLFRLFRPTKKAKQKQEPAAPTATYFPLPPEEMERFNKAITREGTQQMEQQKND